jgi:hypothetical protein
MVCGRRGSRRSILTLQESPGLKTRVIALSLLGIELRQFEIAVTSSEAGISVGVEKPGRIPRCLLSGLVRMDFLFPCFQIESRAPRV